MHPNPRVRAQQQQRIRRRADQSDAYTFFNLLTSPELLDRVESLLPEHRERLFPPNRDAVHVLVPSLERRPLLPAGGERCVGQALDRRSVGVQHAHRRLLPCPSAIAVVDASESRAPHRADDE